MTIIENIETDSWMTKFEDTQQLHAIKALESGKILLLPRLAFALHPMETKFLVPEYAHPKAKNISYNRDEDVLNCNVCTATDYLALKQMLARFSSHAETLVRQLFAPYSNRLQVGRTSLRVTEIAGRESSVRKDDSRLHIDAFPATPNHGYRILRVFCNINPEGLPRVWRVGEPFDIVARRFLPQVTHPLPGSANLLRMLGITKEVRSLYDHIMLQIHDLMKADTHYQEQQEEVQPVIQFDAQSTWIVQTDHVSHAALSGQHVLEQTFYIPVSSMLDPTQSPLHTLEKLSGRRLTHRGRKKIQTGEHSKN